MHVLYVLVDEPSIHFLEYGPFFERLLEMCEPSDPEHALLADSLSLVNRAFAHIQSHNEQSRMVFVFRGGSCGKHFLVLSPTDTLTFAMNFLSLGPCS